MRASAGMGVIDGSLPAALGDGGGLVAGAAAVVVGDGAAAWMGWLVAGAGAVGAVFVGGGAAWLGWLVAGPGAGAVVVGVSDSGGLRPKLPVASSRFSDR